MLIIRPLNFMEINIGVNQFCYLGYMISAGDGAEANTIARVRCG